jgi:hypothetical protein
MVKIQGNPQLLFRRHGLIDSLLFRVKHFISGIVEHQEMERARASEPRSLRGRNHGKARGQMTDDRGQKRAEPQNNGDQSLSYNSKEQKAWSKEQGQSLGDTQFGKQQKPVNSY